LGVNDRLVTCIFCDSELLNQGEHLCAWFHAIVISPPDGDGTLTGFFAVFILA